MCGLRQKSNFAILYVPAFPLSLVEKTILSTLSILHSLVDHVCVLCLFVFFASGLSSVSLVHVSVFMLVPFI